MTESSDESDGKQDFKCEKCGEKWRALPDSDMEWKSGVIMSLCRHCFFESKQECRNYVLFLKFASVAVLIGSLIYVALR